VTGTGGDLPRLVIPEIEPPRHRMSAALLIALVCLAVGAVSFVVGAQWGAETESRKWWREWNQTRRDAEPPARSRGDLWLRCPSSATWRNYAGPQEWHVVTNDDQVMTDGGASR